MEGTLERIVFRNPDNSWTVARVREDGTNRLRTVVGRLPGVAVGESLRLRGRWVNNPKFGEQLEIDSFEVRAPVTSTGIEKYLGSGLVPGIGPEIAKRMVHRFGETTLEVIEKEPRRLLEIEGIGAKRLGLIREGWGTQKSLREAMVFLHDLPIGAAIASRIYLQYGERCVEVVRKDPYRLADEVFLVGFQTADKIAQAVGIDRNSPRRTDAGVLYLLGRFSQSGHVCYPKEELIGQAAQFLEIEEMLVEEAIGRLREAHLVREEEIEADRPAIYRTEMAEAEERVALGIEDLLESDPPRDVDSLEALQWAERALDLSLGAQQSQAVEAAIENQVTIVTGGPGTGKTTMVRSLLAILSRTGDEVLLCAPTGRAAKKLEEATDQPASTIHRLLEFDPRSGEFLRNEENPLTASTVIVDEVSMVDLLLMDRLLLALLPGSRLVLVGDVDQLPSVGPGTVLRDLISSRRIRTVFLEEIYRQARESKIIVNAHKVNHGLMPDLGQEGGDFLFIETRDSAHALEKIKDLLAREIYERFGFDALQDVQVLTPMNKGIAGVHNLNKELQALLNPDGAQVVKDDKVLRKNDKVMQVRNNYEKDVFNGDVGRIREIDGETSEVVVQFGPRRVLYTFAQLDELSLAYAVSVHKSQGSEYRAVVVPLLGEHFPMLQRNLLYTALTRGRELVILLGTHRTVGMAVKNNRITQRYSFLAERIQKTARSREH